MVDDLSGLMLADPKTKADNCRGDVNMKGA
jgi:hypothetical protein